MDIVGIASFALIMLGLAALPSASVALVVARSSTHGLPNGIAASIGIVAGDLVFIALALFGVRAIAESLGALFTAVRFIAATYLVWFGYSLIRSTGADVVPKGEPGGASSLIASLVAGFTLTLGDLKAIVFYVSLFPALFDLASLSTKDFVAIVAVTVIVLGGVKMAYAVASTRIVGKFSKHPHGKKIKRVTGGALMGAGVYLFVKP